MTRRTAAGVRRAEPDEKTAAHDEQPSLEREQRTPVKQLVRDESCKVVNAEPREVGVCPGGDGDGFRACEQHAADEPAHHDAAREHQVPQAGSRPVVLEERDVPREQDRKSTRLNSSHSQISYAVFCLKKKIKASAPAPAPKTCYATASHATHDSVV